ncbi:unnamed protein product [Leuciscus chuanchicus]
MDDPVDEEAALIREIDGFLLGDRGYPCRLTLITPYPEPEPGPQRIQCGTLQDESPGGDDHRPVESTFPVPTSPQGNP